MRLSATFVRGAPAALLAVAACSVPNHMHVTQGVAPQNVDTNVRFRTTYYFRVFDYCWAADATAATDADKAVAYRRIIPETDTLYRYRLTGKASALGSNIKFESGALKAADIDPFGADVVYNGDINGYLVRSQDDARREAAEAAADRRAAAQAEAARHDADGALARFQALEKLYEGTGTIAESARADVREKLKAAMGEALQDYIGTLRAPLSDAMKQRFNDLDKALAKLAPAGGQTSPPAAASAQAIAKEAVEQARAAMIDAVKQEVAAGRVAAPTKAALCPFGEIQRKGFQVMGPEGMRPFNQNERLVMAMYTSAKPLTETLTEYSGRILRARVNPAEQLLPLSRETLRIVETQRALDGVAVKVAAGGDPKPLLDDVFATALDTFDAAPH